LILGAVKCTLCLLLALLKPIVEISKVVITLTALFEVVKIAEAIVIPRLAVLESIVCEFLRVFRNIVWLGRCVVGGGIDVGVIVYRGPRVFRCGGSGALMMMSGAASARRCW